MDPDQRKGFDINIVIITAKKITNPANIYFFLKYFLRSLFIYLSLFIDYALADYSPFRESFIAFK